MKKVLALTILITMLGGMITYKSYTAYGEKFDESKLQAYIEDTSSHMTAFAMGNGDLESFKAHNEEFNTYLESMDSFFASDVHDKYIDLQLKANNVRLKALKEMDYDLITKSSEIQNKANNYLHLIQNRKVY